MKKFSLLPMIFMLLCSMGAAAQQSSTGNGIHFERSSSFDDSLLHIIRRAGMDSLFDAGEDGMERISFAVIDLSTPRPVLGSVHAENFIYPASVYKMYVAMEALRQMSEGKYSLYTPYIVQSPNDVDKSSEILWDPRPLLHAGDTVTIGYLLDLMITRSDNSASNCLIDITRRENINKTMLAYGWQGSEVTRKFLSRKLEDPGYDTVKSTETSALHAAEFMYRIYTHTLVNPWVSMQLKSYLGRQLDTTKLGTGLPQKAMFYHKTGWWSMYTHDVGIVDDGKVRFIIALFTPVPEMEARTRMQQVAADVYRLISGKR